tara:strand:- start:6343 stop:7188 length:846 start_codon:yes stop_codon:yes gene_type:complete
MASEKEILELKQKAKDLRKELLTTIYNVQSGHPGGSLSAIDMMVALYHYRLNIKPKKPHWDDRDRFVLSKGHCSPALYSVLSDRNYFPKSELKNFRKINSLLQGHPELKTPGVDFAGGALGQGICFAVGIALAGKLDKKDYQVVAMIGDGEAQEGAVWEASMAAPHFKLDNMIAILDKNQIQETGKTEDVMDLGDVVAKWKAFGWNVIEINGHDMEACVNALDTAWDNKNGKPTMIISNTLKGKGVSFMELNHNFHGKAPNDEEYKNALEEIDNIDINTFK